MRSPALLTATAGQWQEAFQDQIALLDLFKSKCGSPIRTIAWGQSLGGLVTAGLAQLFPTRFAGALPYVRSGCWQCGNLESVT